MNKRVAFKTLGCRLNQYETDSIASQFARNGYKIVNYEENADVYIVNSCTVTNQSDKKSRYTINHAIKRKSDDSLMVLTGCMATHYKEKLSQNPDLNYVIDNDRKSAVFEVVDAHFKGEIIDPDSLEKKVFGFAPGKETFHTRSMIKIQDGCNNFCTFCIVPFVRGRATSRPDSAILENIGQVLAYGYKEIVLTGVNITRYDYNGMTFDDLLEKILAIPGDFRVRISSIEPEGFGQKFYTLLQHPKMTPHLHICLQSGSDKVLLRMRRMYNLTTFRRIVNQIRAVVPNMNFTTDIIVGFPGETDADFEQTQEVIREIGFSHIHTFKYSVRNGTRAARMPEQVDERTKNARSEHIRKLAEQNKQEYRQKFVGTRQKMLVERIENGMARGYGQYYVPIEIPAEGVEHNTFVNVQLKGLVKIQDDYILTGKRVDA